MYYKRIFALVLSLGLLLGLAAPSISVAEDAAAAQKTDIVIHKMKLSNLNDWPKKKNGDGTYTGADGKTKYDGTKITDTNAYFGAGINPEELDGVRFTYWKLKDKDEYDKLEKAKTTAKTVEEVENLLDEETKKTKKLTDFTKNKEGVKVEGLEEGYYWFIENDDTKLSEGKTVVEYKAAPFGLILPAYKEDGTTFGQGDEKALHIYPKNEVADKPVLDKNFTGKASVDNGSTPSPKEDTSYSIGEDVSYEIKTKIPAKVIYKQAYWVDEMTEGLTFNNDATVVVKVNDGNQDENLEVDTHYEVEVTQNNGFKLVLTKTGLEKITKKNKEVIVTISYTARLNSKTMVDVPESNEVSFHYGNNKVTDKEGNNPIPMKPSGEKKITVTFEDDGSNEVSKQQVEIKLLDAQTNELANGVDNSAQLSKDQHTNKEFSGLKEDSEYKVVVEIIPEGYDVIYTKEQDGNLKIKLVYTGNPAPIRVQGPKVFTYGKKFVKMDNYKKERLVGAQFVIYKEENGVGVAKTKKYLAIEDANGKRAELEAAKTEIDNLLKEYKELSAEDQEKETGKQKKTTIDEKQKAYAKKLQDILVNVKIKWVEEAEKNQALVLTSDSEGKFEYKGLKKGKYFLEEIKAPAGYAKLTTPVEFTADSMTYSKKVEDGTHTDYKPGDADKKDAQVITNKKIVIPETGGIGTLIFTVIGTSLMGLALVGILRRRRKEEN